MRNHVHASCSCRGGCPLLCACYPACAAAPCMEPLHSLYVDSITHIHTNTRGHIRVRAYKCVRSFTHALRPGRKQARQLLQHITCCWGGDCSGRRAIWIYQLRCARWGALALAHNPGMECAGHAFACIQEAGAAHVCSALLFLARQDSCGTLC